MASTGGYTLQNNLPRPWMVPVGPGCSGGIPSYILGQNQTVTGYDSQNVSSKHIKVAG